MSAICCCVDLDGFRVQGQFQVRELGWCDWERNRVGCYHYKPSIPFASLNAVDKRTVSYVQTYVTGLPYYPSRRERDVREQSHVKDDLVEIWRKCKTPFARKVAYKGGHLERDLLDDLSIPSVNLELVGCPKYEQCTALPFDCGCHDPTKHFVTHCSMSEAFAFMHWFNTTQ